MWLNVTIILSKPKGSVLYIPSFLTDHISDLIFLSLRPLHMTCQNTHHLYQLNILNLHIHLLVLKITSLRFLKSGEITYLWTFVSNEATPTTISCALVTANEDNFGCIGTGLYLEWASDSGGSAGAGERVDDTQVQRTVYYK